MNQQKKRIFVLAAVMVVLTAAISIFSTTLLYQTSLSEQRERLRELVQSQASLAQELGRIDLHSVESERGVPSLEIILSHLIRAHRHFAAQRTSGTFTVGRLTKTGVSFLIVNGERVPSFSPLANIAEDDFLGEPMQKALHGESGTMNGIDYEEREVLAAYTPLDILGENLGLVAKIDIDRIRGPFFRANYIIFSVGVILIIFGLFIFMKLSEPILQGIQKSEKNYRDLVEGANNLIVRINNEGTISFANSFARRFLAPKGEDVVGQNAMVLLGNTPSGAESSESLENVMSLFEGSDGLHEIPLRLEDGSQRWLSWTVRKIADEKGQETELLCIGNDITARHLARMAQREIEERFRGIAKASPVGIVITDLEGNLLYANERMHELSGSNAIELSGQGWLRRVDKDHGQRLKAAWFHHQEPGGDSVEFQLKHSDGHDLWILGQMVTLKNDDGSGVGYVATLTDITKMKAVESERSRLTAAIDQAAEAILLTDIEGVITYVNPAFERITGYSPQEAIGQKPKILQSGEQDAAFYKALWDTLKSGEVWSGRLVNARKDGKSYTQEETIGPVRNDQGQTVGYVGVARDISEQLMVEAQLRQAQKLESIGELAAGIAHEINTPTQYVSTNTQFMDESFVTLLGMLERSANLVHAVQKGVPPEELLRLADIALDEKELKYLAEDIPKAVAESEAGLKRIAEIVQSVKQLAHPGEMSKGLHNLNQIVKNAVTVSTNEWKYVAEVELQLDDKLPEIHCHRGEIGQVVLNLIINSAHAIESKIGTNADHKGRITIQTLREETWAVLRVKDTGAGMSQKVLARAFDPFFTTKEVGKGTGQGLAITHNVVVNTHGGTIDVETEEGVGSTFVIKLPL